MRPVPVIARSLHVFATFARFWILKITVDPDTLAAPVPEDASTVKQDDGEESLEESYPESVPVRALLYVRAIPVPVTKDELTSVGYVMTSFVIVAEGEVATVEYSPFALKARTSA